ILLTAGVVLAAAIVLGIGWRLADRRSRARLAEVRATLTQQIAEETEAWELMRGDRDHVMRMCGQRDHELDVLRAELEAMTRAHHRGQYEYERLLEIHRAVPEAFRAPLGHLDRDRAPAVLLYDAWPMPSPSDDAAEAVRLAAMLGEDTGVWSRVVYRAPSAARTATVAADTVHEGELLPAVGTALVRARDYPAKRKKGRH